MVLAGRRWQAAVAGIPAPRADAGPDEDENCNPEQDGNDCKPAEVPEYQEDGG